VRLCGGSATDFRPVFAHVEQLQKSGEFSSLRGMIYFTDGLGTYPAKRPPYETAFVFIKEPPASIRVPAWAIKLVLDDDSLERAMESAAQSEIYADEILEELPQL